MSFQNIEIDKSIFLQELKEVRHEDLQDLDKINVDNSEFLTDLFDELPFFVKEEGNETQITTISASRHQE